MTKRFLAAIERKVSMWQLDTAATNASSGSTASSRERGSGTTDGDEDAATVMPPSNDHEWLRL